MDAIQKAEHFVLNLFKDKLSGAFTYHNLKHTLRVVSAGKELSASENLSDTERQAIALATWFHDTGYVEGEKNHEEKSAEIFRTFSREESLGTELTELTESLIRITEITRIPQTIPEFIIRDADAAHFADERYFKISEQLKKEWATTQGKHFTDLEWLEGNLEMLVKKHRFYSVYANENWQRKKEENIALLREKINELKQPIQNAKTVEETEKKQKKDKKEKTERGVETMFKITAANHTKLSQIADSKANILLSVNAIIISISLSTLIPKLDSPGNAHLIVPTFVLLSFSVTSIIFAILSTRPKVTQGAFTRKQVDEQKINLLFFGNFYKMPYDDYQWAMNQMMKDPEYLYNSMIKDLYYLGLVLHRKYKLLRITYNIFMAGIILSSIAFVYGFWSIR